VVNIHGYNIDLVQLAAVLRLADALDISRKRTGTLLTSGRD